MGNKSNALRRIAFWLKARSLRGTASEHGSLSHVLERVRQEKLHKERQLILSYQAINNPKPGFSISMPKRVTAAFLAFILIFTALTVVNYGPVSGATFTFSQTDWAGGTDGGTYPVHPTNQTGWNKYESKDAGITAAAGNLALTLNNGSNTQTTDADFNAGTKTNVTVGSNNVTLSTASTSYSWTPSTSTAVPSARYGSCEVYNPTANKFYIHGGQTLGGGGWNETYSFDPTSSSYVNLSPSGSPPNRHRFGCDWDSVNKRMYVWGDLSLSAIMYYEPALNRWTQPTTTGGPPASRRSNTMVYDPGNQKFYMFGGDTTGGGVAQNDLWSFTPATNTWAQLSPTGGPPAARYEHSAVWDTQNNKMWVYGGPDNQIWSYTPSTNAWAQVTPTGTPPIMSQHKAVWDSTNNKMWVFGGSGPVNTLYSYTPSTNVWTQVTYSGTVTARDLHAMSFSSSNGKVYIFGGNINASTSTNEDNIYDPVANSWSAITEVTTKPSARQGATFAWDPNNNLAYMFGGNDGAAKNDLWSYNPTTGQWSQLSPTGGPPGIRSDHTAVWDSQNNKMWVFGGSGPLNDLWSYTPSTNTWAQATPTGGPPVARSQHAAVWDSTNNKMWVIDGSGATSDLWSYTPSTNTWAQASPTGGPPSDRHYHAAAWDSTNNKVWVFGGFAAGAYANDLWSYTPSTNTWAQLSPTGGPPEARNASRAVWDSVAAKLYVNSGYGVTSGALNDTWAYDPAANTWTLLSTNGPLPGGRHSAAAAWNSSTRTMYISTGWSALNDTHQLAVASSYGASGDLISSAIDTGQGSNYDTLNWAGSVPANTVLRFQLRSATTSGGLTTATWYGPTGTGDYYTTSGAAINSVHNGHRWVQYRAYFSTTDTSVTSTLNDITVNFGYYPSSATLIGSPYNSVDANNALARIQWTESLPASTDVKFQVRTAPNSGGVPGVWTSWMGPDGTSSTYFTDPSGGETMPSALTTGNNDQWIQYKVLLSTIDATVTPTLSDITLSYVVNGAPIVSNATATQGSNGALTVGYDLADSDSSSSTIAVTASFGVTLSGAINNSVTSLTLSSASSLPAAGSIFIDNEEIQYASKTGNVLNSLTRGRNNSVAASHSDGASVFFKAATVTGHVGASVTNGTGKSVSWTVATDLTNVSTATGQIKIFANDGNLANQQGTGTASNVTIDTTAPTLVLSSGSYVRSAATSSTAVTVSWTTNEASNSFVDYGTTTAYGTTASDAALTTTHSVAITSLTANTTYYFRIRTTDASGNTLTDDNGGVSYTFTTPVSDAGPSRPVDTSPPAITKIQVANIATNGATVTWTTDEEASSIVNYGFTNTYGSLAGVSDIFTTSHTVVISGLIPGTVYSYQVVSLDRSANRSASANATFTTLATTGSGTGDGTGSGADTTVLEGQINELANANVALNTQINELNAKLGSAISEDEKRAILRDLENLRSEIDSNIRKISELSKFKEENSSLRAEVAKLRQDLSDITNKILGLKQGDSLSPADLFKLVSRKFNDLARDLKLTATVEERVQLEDDLSGAALTLKELSELVPPPKVLTRPAIEVTSASATVTWTTDKATFGSVLYGDDATFRTNRTYVSQANNAAGLTRSHSITLTGLAPATLYHYQIAAKSEAGAETTSADFTFTTKTASPIISNGRVVRVNDTTVQVSWQTTLPSNSVVTYTPYINGTLDGTQALAEGKPELTLNHSVTVGDLKPATTYDIEISSTDAFGNTVVDRLGRIVTSEDKIAPVISQVRTEISVIPGSQNRVQVIISWRTDEPATTQVFYSPGAATGAAAEQLKQASNLNSELTYSHIAVITNWEPGVIYRFRAVSKDETGNISESKTFTVLTPRQKATVVDLIIDNFTDIFGWTQSKR